MHSKTIVLLYISFTSLTLIEAMNIQEVHIKEESGHHFPVFAMHKFSNGSLVSASEYFWKLFEFDSESNYLYTKCNIDLETLCKVQRACHCDACVFELHSLKSNFSLATGYKLRIFIDDINDNIPYFKARKFTQKVSEYVPENHEIILDQAYDNDSTKFGIQDYRLEPIEPMVTTDLFELIPFNKYDKRPKVKLKQRLDYEKRQVYRMHLIASDAKYITKQIIEILVVDENDNPPIFDRAFYRFTVEENSGLGFQIGTISANDSDSGENGLLRYSMDENDYITVDRESGVIKTKISFDYEAMNHRLHFQIEAKDCGNPSLVTHTSVIIDIVDMNDNAPVIQLAYANTTITKLHKLEMNENSLPEQIIGYIFVSDADSGNNSKVDCFSKNASISLFSENAYVLQVNEMIDREETSSLTITVKCNDKGNPPLVSEMKIECIIMDQNDNSPVVLNPLNDSVILVNMDNITLPHVLARVSILDSDVTDKGIYVFDLNVDGFEITETGVIVLKKWLPVNNYDILVNITDRGYPPLYTVLKLQVILFKNNSYSREFGTNRYKIFFSWTFALAVCILSLLLFIPLTYVIYIRIVKQSKDIEVMCNHQASLNKQVEKLNDANNAENHYIKRENVIIDNMNTRGSDEGCYSSSDISEFENLCHLSGDGSSVLESMVAVTKTECDITRINGKAQYNQGFLRLCNNSLLFDNFTRRLSSVSYV